MTQAPRSTKSLVTSKLPHATASWSGVTPSHKGPPGSLTLAPCSKSRATISARRAEKDERGSGCSFPETLTGLTIVTMVAGFMEGSPATVVPGVHWVTLICKETKAFIRLFDVTDSVCTFFFLHTIFMNTPNKSFIFEPIDVLIKLHDAGLLFFLRW